MSGFGVLKEERQLDRERYADRYAHVWEGDYARIRRCIFRERTS